MSNGGRKKRIAFVSTMEGAGWGGSEELWGGAALKLLERGDVEVFASVGAWPTPVRQREELVRAGCALEERPSLARWRERVLDDARKALRLTGTPFLARCAPDLVVISQGAHFDGAGWMLEAHNRGLKYAPIAQCFVEGAVYADTHAEPLRTGYENAAAAYFVSEANLSATRRQVAVELPRGCVVRNPYNVSYEARPAWPEPEDGVYRLACVARLDTVVKGIDVLFDALRHPRWKARPLRLTMYGHGPNERTLKRLKEMYGLDNVTFAGTTADVEGIWREHHGLVLASRWEGLPLAVVEAMLCGRVCVVTDVGGSAELLTDGESGFVAAAPKTHLVDAALERAWDRRGEWREIGERAASQARCQVPRDPIQVFTDELLRLLDS